MMDPGLKLWVGERVIHGIKGYLRCGYLISENDWNITCQTL